MKVGIIINNISSLYEVKVEDIVYEAVARGKFKKSEKEPLVGDNVKLDIIDEINHKAVINDILDRKTYIKRPKMANLTQIVLVVSMNLPKPDLLLLDKQLAFAEYNGINPIICLNKVDLDNKELHTHIKDLYSNIGYKVIETEAKNGKGILELIEVLKDNITAFSGNSGVGKSTLINAIFKKEITEEGNISLKNKRGKNTTTSTRLYEIDKNVYIADTPGFSTFDITEIGSIDLYKYFKEFKEFEEGCEFVGCSHIYENKCGIKDALNNNKISLERYERYCKIYLELKDKEDKKW